MKLNADLKRTILIENKFSITAKKQPASSKIKMKESSITIENIGFLVLDHNEIYLSIPAMNLLVANNTFIAICRKNHLPNGMLLNLNSHYRQFKYSLRIL